MKIKNVVINLLCVAAGAAGAAVVVWKSFQKGKWAQSDRITKFVEYFNILDAWMKIKEENKEIESYFTENDIKTIAIYGMGKMGKHLVASLEGTSIEVAYGIDRNTGVASPIKCYGIDEEWPEVDAIVVTATFDFDNIESLIRKKACVEISPEDTNIYDVL